MQILIILTALGLLMFAAYRGASVILVAPVAALLAVLVLDPLALFPVYSGLFMERMASFMKLYFPVFLLHATILQFRRHVSQERGDQMGRYRNEDIAMSRWLADELQKIAGTADLHISPFREDGKAYGTPTWIWSVVVDDGLYVRAYNGKSSRWYQAALRQKAGRITAAAMTKEVSFEPIDGAVNDRIDDAYRTKYKGSPYFDPMIGARARSATVRIEPLER